MRQGKGWTIGSSARDGWLRRFRRWMLLPIVCAAGLPLDANADFTVCNKSGTYPLTIAWAYHRTAVIPEPFEVSGWYNVPARQCKRLASGAIRGANLYLHAIAEGIVLTTDSTGAQPMDTARALCAKDDKFSYRRSELNASSCGGDEYLAPFPIRILSQDDVANITVDIDPDEEVDNNPDGDRGGRARLPDLYGAIASSTKASAGSRFHKTRELARRAAMTDCESRSGGAVCSLDAEFKNQCASVAVDGKELYIAHTRPEGVESQARSEALRKCAAGGSQACREMISVCSTYAQRNGERAKREQEAVDAVTDWLGSTLCELGGLC